MAHTHSLSHRDREKENAKEKEERSRQRGRAAETESCVKSRISWRLFIMHNVPPTVECGRVKLLTQFVGMRVRVSVYLCVCVCVCVWVSVSPVGALIAYGAHIIQLSFG